MKIVAFYSNLITAGVTQRKLVVKLRNISVATERKVVGSSGNVTIPSLAQLKTYTAKKTNKLHCSLLGNPHHQHSMFNIVFLANKSFYNGCSSSRPHIGSKE